MQKPAHFVLPSPAKLNLFLEVIGRRPDGFHELETVMVRTDFCDWMAFEESDGPDVSLALASQSSTAAAVGFPLDETNLIQRAAVAVQNYAGVQRAARLTVQKRIPAEAGLAGGSSNAATAIIGLNRLWDLKLARAQLHEIAATLGSDINFFLEGSRAAVCRGRGEIVSPVDMNGTIYVVAARPFVGNSTAAVFGALDESYEQQSADSLLRRLPNASAQMIANICFNRLTDAARHQNPEMCGMIRRMERICARKVFMSGSGSTCFVPARSRREAGLLFRRLRQLPTAFLRILRI